MIAVLAAGGSRRLGEPKQLLRRDGESLLHRSVREAQACGLPVLLVLGSDSARCREEVEDLGPQILDNPHWANGMGGSIAWAARAVQGAALLIALADQPQVGAGQYRALIRCFRTGTGRICIADYGAGCCGPPALFAADFLPELTQLTGDQGARMIVRRHTRDTVRVPMPEAALDIDTPQDRARWEQGR